jgi:hypothetical protein
MSIRCTLGATEFSRPLAVLVLCSWEYQVESLVSGQIPGQYSKIECSTLFPYSYWLIIRYVLKLGAVCSKLLTVSLDET